MPVSAIRAHLNICSTLTTELQKKFPSGLVVPFGAAISGHGTLSSDCDICLFTELSEQERALFTPPSYQPRDLQPSITHPLPTTGTTLPLTSTDSPLNNTPTTSASIAAPLTPPAAACLPMTSRVRESCSPIGDELQSSSSEAGSSPAASPQAAPRGDTSTSSTSTSSRGNFDMVVSSIREMPECSKILPIPHARCPIVRFVYDPASVHCDLSIDNV